MLIIKSPNTSPYFNLAAEEYLMFNTSEDILFLYVNSASIITGKNQNILAEINYPYCKKKEINLCRRISGGGTVYHDEGNINFSFIVNEQEKDLMSYQKYTQPIIDFLLTQGIVAELKGNSIYIDQLKCSGNAKHFSKNRLLHHGTLLFSSNKNDLHQSLIPSNSYSSKAVKSVSANITNIDDHLTKKQECTLFLENLIDFFKTEKKATKRDLSISEINQIELLKMTKYSSWEWIFGASPNYDFNNEFLFEKDVIKISFKVSKGKIYSVLVKSNNQVLNKIINQSLQYKLHKEEIIIEQLMLEMTETEATQICNYLF